MKKTGIQSLILLFIILFLSVSPVFAITGSIGNSRMILRDVKVGDTIERSILVINKNEVPVQISISAAGDLASDIEIIDKEFVLSPGEEKKARFEIKIKEEGETESNINIAFTPEDGKNGVGLTATIIVIATKDGISDYDEVPEDDTLDDLEEDSENSGVNVNPGTNANAVSENGVDFKINGVVVAVALTLIMFIILVILLVIYSNKNKRGLVLRDEIKPKKSVLKK